MVLGQLTYGQIQSVPEWIYADYALKSALRDSLNVIRATIPTSTGGPETDPVWAAQKSGYATLPISFPPETDPIYSIAAPGLATTTALTNGLAMKANTSHSQAISTVTDLQTTLDSKQVTLVSGTNIKTINGSTVLGIGDLVVTGTSVGYVLQCASLTSTMATATTYYFANALAAPTTTQNLYRCYVPKSGTLKAAYVYFQKGGAGIYTSGNLVVSVNYNNVASQIASAANFNSQLFSKTDFALAVTAGGIIEIKVTTPTLSSSGTTCFWMATLYIE